ncbi:Rne/Rng family ribonuclease [Priestia endophytica]|uniref:Ribonuclease G n=1 Tax=Priestia endophytica DSM 13796 TaxID=1121089 RepID=A0A1I5WN16_9BACI|nr:Rne/Rng family ribonuclease [Priestia endophytica]KYG36214.1 hypothetical protein AZF06_03180 [Priestia endophytica]MBG9815152.1 hypothetical protein [Priestia endophytica]SFQ21184.1 ribonuclease G [Priestia endophytica DSM 13796]
MTAKLIIETATNLHKIAHLQDSQVQAFYIEEQKAIHYVGNIYVGRVKKVVKGMDAAFVDIGGDKNGYLHKSEVFLDEHEMFTERIKEGQKILVQVSKEERGTKGPKLTTFIEFSSSYVVYFPYSGYVAVSKKIAEKEKWKSFGESIVEGTEGLLLRSAIEGMSPSKVEQEIVTLRKEAEGVIGELQAEGTVPRVVYQREDFITNMIKKAKMDKLELIVDSFETKKKLQASFPEATVIFQREKESLFDIYHLQKELEKALQKTVWLPSGGSLVIEETEAMTVIDVNTSRFVGKTSQAQTVLETNLEAAKEVARQLRLRNLGGIIMIDFINMKNKEDGEKVLQKLKTETEQDPVRTLIFGFTRLGLVEVTRKKERDSLQHLLLKDCGVCKTMGKYKNEKKTLDDIEGELLSYKEEAAWIELSPLLSFNREEMEKWKEEQGIELYLTEGGELTPFYRLRHIGSREEVEKRIKENKAEFLF